MRRRKRKWDSLVATRVSAEARAKLEREADERDVTLSEVLRERLTQSVVLPDRWWSHLQRQAQLRPPIERATPERLARSIIGRQLPPALRERT